jgi:exodeoxyribonuclease VII small subunit
VSVPSDSNSSDFEQGLEELERLVERLEHGDLPLEEALKSFERGVELTRRCQGTLRAAQQRVEILLRRDGAPSPFAVSDEEPASAGPPSVPSREAAGSPADRER